MYVGSLQLVRAISLKEVCGYWAGCTSCEGWIPKHLCNEANLVLPLCRREMGITVRVDFGSA